MAIPTASDLATLNFAWLGEPFADVPAKAAVNVATLDYAWLGQPFVTGATRDATLGGFLMVF